jgi:hypothetical protein
VEIEHPDGNVSFDTETGRLTYAFLKFPTEILPQPLDQIQSEQLATDAVRHFGWRGEVSLNLFGKFPRESDKNGLQYLNYWVSPVVNGIAYDPKSAYRVVVDATTGSLVSLSQRNVPNPPTRMNVAISSIHAEGVAVQHWSKRFKSDEYHFIEPTKLVITRPSHRKFADVETFSGEMERNEGILAYRVVVQTQSRLGEGFWDTCTYWVGAESGKIVNNAGGTAELTASGLTRTDGKGSSWPSGLQPFKVSGERGTRSAFGGIVSAPGELGAGAMEVQLRIKDRLLIAKFDASQNLVRVGSRVGRPTGHLAEALRAVTR